jgi:hypothetical protein
MPLDWKTIEYLILGVVCLSLVGALFLAKH